MSKNTDLGKDGIGRLMLRLAVPAIAAQVINALYNIVDRIYIGNLPGAQGTQSIAALGVSLPLIVVISAFGSLVGIGGSALAAIRMGEGQQEKANRILNNCLPLVVIFSLILTAVCEFFCRDLLLPVGATENTIDYAEQYFSIYAWGTLPVLLVLGLNAFINTQGFATTSMLTVLIGAVTNIILDPIFIFVFDMGVKGAALATITAQAVSAVWGLRFLTGKQTRLRLQRRYARLDWKILGPVLALGVSPFIMQSTESLVNIAFNSSLKAYGGDPAVGAMTICSSVMQVFFLMLQGFSQGAQPIIGFNYGAGNLDRVKKAFRLLLTCTLTVSVTGCAVIQLFPGFFVGLFNDEPALVDIAVWTLRVYVGGMFLFGVQSACQQTFVALGQAKASLVMALLRKVILLIPLIFILPNFIANKVLAVFLAEPVADLLAATITGTVFFIRFPKILQERKKTLAAQA